MDKKIKILVTGSDGQLGMSFQEISKLYHIYDFYFENKLNLDISNKNKLDNYIKRNKINTLINCAAFTNVEVSESNKQKADLINNISVGNIAKICSVNSIQLIHLSTDYVFDGNKHKPYSEKDKTNPINYYGLTKLEGEKKILKFNLNKSAIIRTSWLYSNYGNNFVNKIIDKINKCEGFSVVDNQIGTPTNSNDLANMILHIIPLLKNNKTEIYHYSNLGKCSRYEFAQKINIFMGKKSKIQPIVVPISKVNRPKNSVLNSNKIINDFNLHISDWKSSLSKLLKNRIN
tara:strand:+ start:233 stop:1099 length:867 start_codon:yes stop_codon:yes gene_type:complete